MSEMNQSEFPVASRNEPCPCGSGKKYKKCHGESSGQKMSPQQQFQSLQGGGAPALPGMGAGAEGMPDMNSAMMQNMMSAFQRLPKAQLQRFQSLMRKAMAGKDVTREAAELERMLPPQFQQMMISMMGAMGMAAKNQNEAAAQGLSEDEARKIVEAAAKEGKISSDEAAGLLAGTPKSESKGFWKGLIGKKN